MKRFTAKRKNRAGEKLYFMRCHFRMHQQKGDLSPKHFRYRGIALAWTAIVFTVILLLVGLSLDTAKLCYNVHQMQNATDAAVLAGAQIVKKSLPDDVRLFTHNLGLANKAEQIDVYLRMDPQPTEEPFTGDPNAYDILIGRWVRYNRTFVPTLDAPNAVQAIAHRNASMGAVGPAIKYIFGPLAGVPDANATTLAVGWCYDSGGAGLICLDTEAKPGLLIAPGTVLNIDGGGIHVNAEYSDDNPQDSKNATDIQGGGNEGRPQIDAGFMNVVGEIAPEPYSPLWEDIFGVAQDGGIVEGEYGFSVSDYSTIPSPTYLADPLAAKLVGNDLVTYNPDKLPEEVWDQLKPELIGTTISTITQTLDGQNVPTSGPIDFSCTLGPGYYPYGLNLSNGVDIKLDPTSDSGLGTIFVFGGTGGIQGGGGIVMTSGSLTGEGVTCYVTKNINTGGYGEIRVDGGVLHLWSPGDWTNKQNIDGGGQFDSSLVTGLNGIAVWQDPMMGYIQSGTFVHPDVHLNGNGEFNISGTLYFPDPILADLEGNLGQAGNQIICGSAELSGGALITVNYDGRNRGESSHVCLAK